MTLKDSINNLIIQNKAVLEFVKATYSLSADEAILKYANQLKDSKNNSILTLTFAHTLQFASDPTVAEQFEPEDIEALYDSFLTLSNLYLNAYIDAANYIDHNSSNKKKAKEILKAGINQLSIQLSELEQMQEELSQ
ncbi:hypothetical protein [Paraflavitalea sp. CAU 1676]|uniref:hypothetical protein n=1 Tax=Paraflavitalea sp. CAU 1676 TaxID=3032598 RepID=UPI0023DA7FA1|nr:hypothetical protein [Paraflavitalea sp. CAU 1676]MDF2188088.1 hypothetical protein [Paraflavitalea sp. CAU 1676]